MSVYVEILLRAPLDAVWTHTQTPSLHEQWDVRFSTIEYAARTAVPQRFRYTTRLGCGLAISGEGETTGTRDLPDGSAVSALTFGSEDRRSIIRRGSGYWKYIPTHDGVRFLTAYDYQTRFGCAGALLDRLIFRPLIGWGTAWSFDRLRLWLEKQISPASALRCGIAHLLARASLAGVFAYQGLVPKLMAHNGEDLAMLASAGVPPAWTGLALATVGALEIAFAAALLTAWSCAWPAWLAIVGMIAATLVPALRFPAVFEAAFNPLALNLAVAALAAIDLVVLPDVPFAGRCRRRPERHRS